MRVNTYYDLGFEDIVHKNRKVRSVSLSEEANDFVANLDDGFDYDVVYIPAGFEHRPDLISEIFYDTPTLDWLIMLVNSLYDPFENFNVGDRLLIPKL